MLYRVKGLLSCVASMPSLHLFLQEPLHHVGQDVDTPKCYNYLMKLTKLAIFTLLLTATLSLSIALADSYESINLINSINWTKYVNNSLNYLYDSRDCLKFTPSDAYLLTKTIPKDTPLIIKSYNDQNITAEMLNAPYFSESVNSDQDIETYAKLFINNQTKLILYPSQKRLYITVNNIPKFQAVCFAGPKEEFKQLIAMAKNGFITLEATPIKPTDSGDFKILEKTSHHISNTDYDNTVVPFGSLIKKEEDGNFSFIDGKQSYILPKSLADDLSLPFENIKYAFYDLDYDQSDNIISARFGNNPFGKGVLFFGKGEQDSPFYFAFSDGNESFDQAIFIEDLAEILTDPQSDNFEDCVSNNENFSIYRSIYNFIQSSGESISQDLDPVSCSYYKLFNNFKLTQADLNNLDPRMIDAVNKYNKNELPWFPWEYRKKEELLSLYYYLKSFNISFNDLANRYSALRDQWNNLTSLRLNLREDFTVQNVFSIENRQDIVARWLTNRLEFRQIPQPTTVEAVTFTTYFNQEKEMSTFTKREKEVLHEMIRKAVSGEATMFKINSVDALNNYNFGVLLNDMLGFLYKSHGCLHVSPRNIYLLSHLLPIEAELEIKSYNEKFDEAQLKTIPSLADMVNFGDDLLVLAQKFTDPKKVRIKVYPASQAWIIYIEDKPFAKLELEAGPQNKINLLQSRDKNGKPIFAKDIAYPSQPGRYYILKKLDNYVSNLYHDTTIIPQGAIIKLFGDKWFFQDAKGSWEVLPALLAKDIMLPANKQSFAYYEKIKSGTSESFTQARFGSNPFGKYPMTISTDKKNRSAQLIHTSGDLIMEQRMLIYELIKVLSAPFDSFEDCITYSDNFGAYDACFNFINNPAKEDLLEPIESGNYKVHFNLPLTTKEVSAVPKDVVIANKLFKTKEALTKQEIVLLIKEGLASRRGTKVTYNIEKLNGVLFDSYQYVVMIRKNANIYSTLKANWEALSPLRQALLKDFKQFIIQNPDILYEFTREMILERTNLKRLSQKEAYGLLENLLKIE